MPDTTPYPLGRLREHDPRSRAFPHVPTGRPSLTYSITWPRKAPIFDQGNIGSCTGNAMAGWLGSNPRGNPKADQVLAVALYSEATRLDQWDGTYLPDDTGSSGLAVAKAAQRRGLITSYRHAFSFGAVLDALSRSPIIVGTNWLGDMYSPEPSGYLRCTGEVVGGHEYLIRGVDPRKRHVLCDNSWSASWGRKGRFWLHWADLEALLADGGDATIPIR